MIDSFKVIVAVSFAQSGLLRKATEAQMSFGASDVIQFKDLNTGGNSAGNGGDGYNKGTLTSSQSANFSPYNKAYGSHVDVDTGDHVKQKAYWDAGDANGGKAIAKKGKASADGGKTSSDGSQSSDSGENVSKVWSDLNISACLSARERELALLVAQGLSNKEIARRIGVTPGTVKLHLHNIYQKLGVPNRTVLTMLVYRRQILTETASGRSAVVKSS